MADPSVPVGVFRVVASQVKFCLGHPEQKRMIEVELHVLAPQDLLYITHPCVTNVYMLC